MKNPNKNSQKTTVKTALVFCVIFTLAACAQKPVLKQLDDDAPEAPINSPARADALKKMHSK
jgi:predicted small lipoprotein YifL